MSHTPPPIPAALHDRPVQGGLVVQWIALKTRHGYDFAGCEGRKVNLAMLDGLCQIDGRPIDGPFVFFAAQDQLEDLSDIVVDAPPMHPQCALYSGMACPMVTGRLASYRATETRASREQGCVEPGCDCEGWIRTDSRAAMGIDAQPWYEVWTRDYIRVVRHPKIVAALRSGSTIPGERIYARINTPLRIRPVTPGAPPIRIPERP